MPFENNRSLSKSCLKLTLAVLTVCLDAEAVRSQTIDTQAPNLTPTLPPPPRTEPPLLPAPTPAPLPPRGNLLQPSTPSPPTEQISPGTVDRRITVRRFRFIGNTAYSSKTLANLLVPFTNRPITFADLFQARSILANFYINHGYITSGALIPTNQTIQGGVVTIQVVEGQLERIKVTGTKRLNPNYVRSRLQLAAPKVLNRDHLLQVLQLLQLNPLIKNISAELSIETYSPCHLNVITFSFKRLFVK
jgi:hemolysin activation/secretion protein